MSFFFPDTSVLMNFAAIDELPLLHSYLGDRGRVMQAVESEIKKHSRSFPNLHQLNVEEWFGKSIPIKGDRAVKTVDQIRRFLFGGLETEPLRHLGESETIHILSTDPSHAASIMLTEDVDAFNISRSRNIVTKCTRDVFETLVARYEITSAQAMTMMIAIRDSPLERGIMNVPETASALEP